MDLKTYEQAMILIQENLPCDKCSRGAVLESVRLSKHERYLLLSAPGPDEDKRGFLVATGTRAQKESKLRAMRKLSSVGFVECGWASWGKWGDCYFHNNYHRRVIRRSPLGQAIVECIGEKLAVGEQIRWQKHIDEIHNKVWVGTRELLSTLENNIKEQLSMENGMIPIMLQYQKDPAIIQKNRELVTALENAHKAVKQLLKHDNEYN